MIGTIVSHYNIVAKIGEGGMGVVYKAVDRNLQRTVALKFLPTEWRYSAEAKTRFLQEARAASALDHPNICTVYELGETADGAPFIAMAFYEGESLKARLENQPLTIREAVNICLQIIAGMTKAHQKGIFHRDLKPANIFITTDGVVKILDFGLAKLVGAARLTKSGSTLGTIAYMAPEQIQGGSTDHRADIWSLGVILFEMLAGRLPFDGEFEPALMYAIVHEPPKGVTTFRHEANEALEAVIQKTLLKNPAQRYQDIAALRADVARLTDSTGWSQPEPLSSAEAERATGTLNLPIRRSLVFAAILLTIILVSLFPLKIWRTTILYRAKVVYIPTQPLAPVQLRETAELNIAVILPENHDAVIDIAGKIKYPEILSCKNSAPEKLAKLQPYINQLRVRAFWKKKTLIARIVDGCLDRMDDFPFWSILGLAANAWLLFACVTRLEKNYLRCYLAATRMPLLLCVLGLVLGLAWVVVPAYNQKVQAHGVIFGAFWTGDFIPGVKTTQIVDFILFSIVAIVAAFLLIIKIQMMRTMRAAAFRGYFSETGYLQPWEYLLNSGYFTFLAVNAILILFGTLFPQLDIADDRVNYVAQTFVFQMPFLAITFIAWWLTRDWVDYKLAPFPFFIFWLSAAKRADQV